MDPLRLTRRQFVKRGVTASVVVAVGLDANVAAGASSAGSSGGVDEVLPGVLARVINAQTALVTVPGEGATRVRLAPEAFVAHGVEGKVADLSPFLPGERVAVRGAVADGELAAVEFQSIYTEESGVVAVDRAGRRSVQTAHGPVRLAADVTERPSSGSLGAGAQTSATIWTNPSTGERTAILLCGNA